MKAIAQTPLSDIRAEEQKSKAKDAQLQQLGFSLTEEKIKNSQKDAMITKIGQEVMQMKIEILTLKGSAGV